LTKRVFSIFDKSDLSITNVILLENIFILIYVARTFMMYFFASDINSKLTDVNEKCNEFFNLFFYSNF